jgi:hypothetical protein
MYQQGPYGPMDKAPAYGAGDSGFESQYGLISYATQHHASTYHLLCVRHWSGEFGLLAEGCREIDSSRWLVPPVHGMTISA